MRLPFDSATRKKLGAAIACISIVGVGLSLVIPLLAIRLEAAGLAARANGLHVAVSGLATLIGAPLTPMLTRALGVRRLLFLAIALTVASLLAFASIADKTLWLLIRAPFGFALTVIFVVSETWISAAAPRGQRGVVMGVYATVLALGFAIGPALLSLTGPQGSLPFLLAAGLVAAAALPVALAGEAGTVRMDDSRAKNLRAIFSAAPLALGAALLYGAIETGLNGLLPVFGLRSGFTAATSTFQLTLVALGNVVFPIPIGMIADRADKTRLLAIFAGFGLFGALGLPGLAGDAKIYGFALFLWGGLIGGLYPVGLALLAERFSGARLASANAAYVMMYAFGMIFGPPALGLGMDLASPRGLFDALSLCFLAYLALIFAVLGPLRLTKR